MTAARWPAGGGRDEPGPGGAGGALRFERHARHAGRGYAGAAFFVLASAGIAAGWGFAFALQQQPPVPAGLAVALGVLVGLPMVAGTLFLAAMCWAYTRPGWGRWIRGSVYQDNRWPHRRARVDLATAGTAEVWAWAGDDDRVVYLTVAIPGQPPTRIPLAGSLCTTRGLLPSEKPLVAALAGALAEHPDPAVAGQAVTDLRALAAASPGEISGWMRDGRWPGERVWSPPSPA